MAIIELGEGAPAKWKGGLPKDLSPMEKNSKGVLGKKIKWVKKTFPISNPAPSFDSLTEYQLDLMT